MSKPYSESFTRATEFDDLHRPTELHRTDGALLRSVHAPNMSQQTDDAEVFNDALAELKLCRPRYVREADERAACADAELARVEAEVCSATGIAWPMT